MSPPHPWTQGLLAGAGLGLLPFLGLAFEPLLAVAWLVTAALVVGVLVWAPIDLKRHRRSADWRVTGAVVALAAAVVLVALVSFFGEEPLLDSDAFAALLPPPVLLLAADRFAARRDAAWSQRALAAACGFLAIWPFIIDAQLPDAVLSFGSAVPLAALLFVRLPGSARVVLAVLAGGFALSLGVFVDDTAARRILEWSVFLGYALLSLLAYSLRRAGPVPPRPVRADP